MQVGCQASQNMQLLLYGPLNTQLEVSGEWTQNSGWDFKTLKLILLVKMRALSLYMGPAWNPARSPFTAHCAIHWTNSAGS